MTEREMEDLLWEHPEKFLNEHLTQFERQPSSAVGRADLIFQDRIGRLIVVELKRGTLERGAVAQLIDYFGMLKSRFRDKSVELMVIANQIPPERRLACEQFHIDPVEISEKKFRDVAEQVGYSFKSEVPKSVPPASSNRQSPEVGPNDQARTPSEFSHGPSKIEKAWYYWAAADGLAYFLAFVNAKGSCSMRRFEAASGDFRGREYKSGDYQAAFSDYLRAGVPLYISHQPNLERDCKVRLPTVVLTELARQVPGNQNNR